MKKIFYFLFAILFCITIALAYIIIKNNTVISKEIPQTTSFNQEQKKQIEKIVQDYLVKNITAPIAEADKKLQEKVIHDYLVNNPNVLVEASKKLQEQEVAKEEATIKKIIDTIPKYKKEIFDTKAAGRVVTGNPNGKIIIAEFTQYQCSHCKAVTPIIDKLLKNNPETQLITIYWPFFGNDAIYASKAALAAQKQNKFNELQQAFISSSDFLNKDKIDTIIKSIPGVDANKFHADMDAKEIDSGLKDNLKLANELGIIGTPTFIFTNKEMTKFSLIPGQTRNIENDLNKSLKEVS